MTPAKLYAALVAFKDRCVEAYIRGGAEEQAERHPVPPLGTCALCGRSFQDGLDEARAEERARCLAIVNGHAIGYRSNEAGGDWDDACEAIRADIAADASVAPPAAP